MKLIAWTTTDHCAQEACMVNVPHQWDPESAGSRFTTRPAVGLLVGEVMDEDLPGDAGEQLVREQVGNWVLAQHEHLDAPRVVDSSVGRGADMWIPAIEWTVQAAVGGVVGGLAWAVTTVAAREARTLIHRLRTSREPLGGDDAPRFLVSRGMAAHLAVDHIGSEAPALIVELVEEPSSLRGEAAPELGYVGIEPWIVFLRNDGCTSRHYVVVTPTGECAASMTTAIEEAERFYVFGHLEDGP